MCVLRRVLQTACSPQRKGGEIPKTPSNRKDIFVMLADFPKSSKVIFFKMTSRTAPLLSDKKADPERSACSYSKKVNPNQN